jgi:phosphoserine phosphatase RsbU/P
MNVLIAEDDDVSRRLLETILRLLGHQIVAVTDGLQAWAALVGQSPPRLALLDWNMPGLSGVEICRRLRERPALEAPYVILVTARAQKEDVVAGLTAGADDYVTKPIAHDELAARIQVGMRTLALRDELVESARAVEVAAAEIKVLQGLLPICAYCKSIRDDDESWQPIERYIATRSNAEFTHSICPDCRARLITPMIEKKRREREPS